MTLEIEVKAEANRELLESVRERGDLLGVEQQSDTYYAHPCRDFAETDEALRVREEDGRLFLTYKGPKLDSESKSRVEREVRAEEGVGEILGELGFQPLEPVEKRRESYDVRGFHVTVDEVEGLGTYVEAETTGPEERLEELRDDLRSLLVEMGAKRFERRSYLELLLDL